MVKNQPDNMGNLGLIPGSERLPGEGNGNPLQYSCLENPMDGGAWCPWGRKESDMTERLYFYFTLPTKVRLVKAMVFPVVMYGCEKSEVTQSCPTLCDPMDTRLLHPWDFLGKR